MAALKAADIVLGFLHARNRIAVSHTCELGLGHVTDFGS